MSDLLVVLALTAVFVASVRWGGLCGLGFAAIYLLGRVHDA